MRLRRAFTLVELLISIFIISLLAGTITVSTSKIRSRSRDNRRIADVKTIQGAVELYRADKGGYPSSIIDTVTLSPYLNPAPKDPKSGGYCYSYYNGTAWVKGGAETSNGVNCATNPPLGGAYMPTNYWLETILENTHQEAQNDLSPVLDKNYDIGG